MIPYAWSRPFRDDLLVPSAPKREMIIDLKVDPAEIRGFIDEYFKTQINPYLRDYYEKIS